jgi:hypothetical protein
LVFPQGNAKIILVQLPQKFSIAGQILVDPRPIIKNYIPINITNMSIKSQEVQKGIKVATLQEIKDDDDILVPTKQGSQVVHICSQDTYYTDDKVMNQKIRHLSNSQQKKVRELLLKHFYLFKDIVKPTLNTALKHKITTTTEIPKRKPVYQIPKMLQHVIHQFIENHKKKEKLLKVLVNGPHGLF